MARFVTAEHRLFQEVFRKYVRMKLVPQQEQWQEERQTPKAVWKDCGAHGFLCPWADPQYGGAGGDFVYSYIIANELAHAGVDLALYLHNDIVAPYIGHFGTEEQKRRWLPGCVSGDIVTAIAMTEPQCGSDVQAIKTTAVREGDYYAINGQKVFISNGMNCDLVIVACRTDQIARGSRALSLIAVEDGTPGFVKARKLNKMGLHPQETAELFFENCRVPVRNRIGEENAAFTYMMAKLQGERLISCVTCQAMAERILELSLDYAKTRHAFGQPIGSFQHNQFKLAEMATEVALGRTFVDDLVQDHLDGKDIITKVSMAKWWVAEMSNRLAYQGVQIHGGYGFMEEYEICRLYRDARVNTIGAGTTEILKQVIAKRMGL